MRVSSQHSLPLFSGKKWVYLSMTVCALTNHSDICDVLQINQAKTLFGVFNIMLNTRGLWGVFMLLKSF